jgi:hypothetical protein
MFAYCRNNPINFSDPSGFDRCRDTDGGGSDDDSKLNMAPPFVAGIALTGIMAYSISHPKVVKAATGATVAAGKLTSIGNGIWESTEKLIYEIGSKQGNRVLHVLEHAVPDISKPLHTVFNVGRDKILGLIDEAWAMRGSIIPVAQKSGNEAFDILMGKIIGTNGETTIRIIVEKGTSKIITAFPVK